MTLTQDWMYIQYKQMLFLSVSASVPLTAKAYVSVDGESYQEVSELLGQRTVLGYQPLFPIWMSGWLFADGQRIWVRIEDGEEVEEADYYVDYSVLAPKKARSLARTMAANTLSASLSNPPNLLADIVYIGSSPLPTEGKGATGTSENIVTGMLEVESLEIPIQHIPFPCEVINIPDGTYNGIQFQSGIYMYDGTINMNHKCYLRLKSSNDLLTYSSFLAIQYTYGSTTSNTINCVFSKLNLTDSIASVIFPSNSYYSEGYCIFYILDPNTFTSPSSFVLNQPVLVDITANQSFFNSMGLTTDAQIQEYLDGLEYDEFGQAIGDQPSLPSSYLDGVGLAFFWGKMKDYVDSALGSVQSILPIPLASCSIDGGSALLTLDATYSGYGDITVRYKKDSEPTEADTVLDPVNGAVLTENGSYYVRAFGGSYTPSPSFIVDVSGIVVPAVGDKLPDGSVIFYDRGATYGTYQYDSNGYPVRSDGAEDDGTATSSNWRFLICDKENLNELKLWGAYGTSENLTQTALGYGLPNTEAMLAKYSDSSTCIWQSVQIRRDATDGKKWFVPSIDELSLVYQNKGSIVDAGGGSFPTDYVYWSSSEYSSGNAWFQDFSNGSQDHTTKLYTYSCRLIRRV